MLHGFCPSDPLFCYHNIKIDIIAIMIITASHSTSKHLAAVPARRGAARAAIFLRTSGSGREAWARGGCGVAAWHAAFAAGRLLQRRWGCGGTLAAAALGLRRDVCCSGAGAAAGRLLQGRWGCGGTLAAGVLGLRRDACCSGAGAAAGGLLQRSPE